ncbi:MAG: septum formation initiator family protein [Terracidiphilus sp.]
MLDEKSQTGKVAATEPPVSLHERALDWVQHGWRPAGTFVAVALALLFGWGVVNGKHGLSAWEQQRTQDKQLRQEIQDLQQENAHLRDHIQRLKSDPDAIEHEAREQLHYARPGEVIYTLPASPQTQTQPAGDGK